MELTSARVDRARGVLVGAACGDALGAGYEFGSAPLPANGRPAMIGGGLGGFEPGEWTDDTALTWAVAEVAATGADLRATVALDSIARSFHEWYADDPADIGVLTRHVLRRVGAGPTADQLAAAALATHHELGRTGGNGSLMRTSPVALAHLDDPVALVEAAMKVSALTHADPRAGEACALWCLAIRHSVLVGELDILGGLALLPEHSCQFWAARIGEAETREARTFVPNGYVVTALQAAWSAIHHTLDLSQRSHRGQVVDAVEEAVRIGDDTDTIASITGALVGAKLGASAFPVAWRRVVHGWPGRTAEDLVDLALATCRSSPPNAAR